MDSTECLLVGTMDAEMVDKMVIALVDQKVL